MRKFIIALTFTFGTMVSIAQSHGERYMFTGELLTVPTTSADCGTMANAAVYEFKVTMISDGSYAATNIAIIVKCPELLGANFFKVGATYKMEMFDTMGDVAYGIINQNVLDSYNLAYNYWAGDIKRLQ